MIATVTPPVLHGLEEDVKEAQVIATVHRQRHRRREAEERQMREETEKVEGRLRVALERYESLLDDGEQENEGDVGKKKLELLAEVRECYEELGRWEEALAVEETAWDVIDAKGDDDSSERRDSRDRRAGALYRQGKLHMRLGRQGPAQRLYQDALDLYAYRETQCHTDEDGGDEDDDKIHRPEIGNILISMAGVHYHRGRLQESLDLLLEAESHFVVADDNIGNGDSETELRASHPDLVKCLQHQGLLHRSMEDFDSALDAYRRALEALEVLQQHQQTDSREGNEGAQQDDGYHGKRQGLQLDVADMLGALDRREEALDLYGQVIDEERIHHAADASSSSASLSSSSSHHTPLEGIVLHNCGKIHASMGEHGKAIDELERSLQIKLEVLPDAEHHPEVGKTLQAMGAVYGVTGDKSRALDCFQRALLIARINASADADHDNSADGGGAVGAVDSDPQVLLALRNIAILKGEKVPKWEDGD